MHAKLISIKDIPETEFVFSYARSGGPGGQNVNKVNSKAVLRWAVAASSALPAGVLERFLLKFAGRITADGEIVISSQKYRDQIRNADDCLAKLEKMLVQVWQPRTVRRPTRPGKAAVEKRLQGKHKTAAKKDQRRAPSQD
jgi:ribosome-associated protein